jgi:hypothetical protein
MANQKLHKLPHQDPVTGGELYISELAGLESGITIKGQFEIPRYSRLDAEQARFLETFLRCRGMLSSMEKELGMSYPTLRLRLDSLLEALDLSPIKEEPKAGKTDGRKKKIVDMLEKGEITAEEAKARLRDRVSS